jgi:hypothetical protein
MPLIIDKLYFKGETPVPWGITWLLFFGGNNYRNLALQIGGVSNVKP